eukprot:4195066-Pleurochrysis_carterae.AAC.1
MTAPCRIGACRSPPCCDRPRRAPVLATAFASLRVDRCFAFLVFWSKNRSARVAPRPALTAPAARRFWPLPSPLCAST